MSQKSLRELLDKKEILRIEDIPEDKKTILYSADFNVNPEDSSYDRVDIELKDLDSLIKRKKKVVILAHRGRYEDKREKRDIKFLSAYLKAKLSNIPDVAVNYRNPSIFVYEDGKVIDDRWFEEVSKSIASAKEGEVLIIGNTRNHKGEESNDLELARKFSRLGEAIVVGGFGKAHRANSSNYAILDFIPSYIAGNFLEEVAKLEPFKGKSERPSLAILGGLKKEKINAAKDFLELYQYLMPTGLVLNHFIRARYCEVGKSILSEVKVKDEETREKARIEADELTEKAADMLRNPSYHSRILLPRKVITAIKTEKGLDKVNCVDLYSEKVQGDSMIVSFFLTDEMRKIFDYVSYEKGRNLLAGTPDINGKGPASLEIAARLMAEGAISLVLGGNSASDLGYTGTRSTGGGSAIEYLIKGNLKVLDKMVSVRDKFR